MTERKIYGKIDRFRLLKIKVILDDEEVIFEGKVEEAPGEILNLKYSKLGHINPMELYVYSEDNNL